MKSARLLVAASLLISASAFAQPAPIAAPLAASSPLEGTNWNAIRVKNGTPSLIAWQLDAQHNVMPAFLNVPYSPLPKFAAERKAPPQTKNSFDLPNGVRLAASDEQKLLFVSGGDAQQIAQVQALVSLLDQPLRHVEIEAQFVQLPASELKQFGIATDTATAGASAVAAPIEGAISVGFVRGNFQAQLDEMVKSGIAKVISTKPQILTNNMGLAISLLHGPIDNTGANQNKRLAAPTDGTDTIFTVTPTINGDDTITVLMNTTTLFGNNEQPGLFTIANLRDGEPIALTEFSSLTFPRKIPMLGDIPIGTGLFRAKKPGEERTAVMFVTARVVRDDEK